MEDSKTGLSWHLFNDFLVRPVSEQEALSFPGKWKVSAVCFACWLREAIC